MKNLDRNQFDNMITSDKMSFVNDLVIKNSKLTQEEIKYLTPGNRDAYFDNRTRTSDWVEDYELEAMSDDEKRIHIQYARDLSKNALKNLSQDLQKDFIDACSKAYRDLTEEEFSLLKNDEIKSYYVSSKIKNNRFSTFTAHEMKLMDSEYQIKYINSLARNGMSPSKEIISCLKPEAFRFYQVKGKINEIREIIKEEIKKIIK